jgi:uncharacterized BrkB/YihY/UPF0761 family membrane protein
VENGNGEAGYRPQAVWQYSDGVYRWIYEKDLYRNRFETDYVLKVMALVFGLWLRVCIIAQVGVANSSALYGSFAFFPILLAWVYISWQIILFGSVLSCQLQSIFSSSEA